MHNTQLNNCRQNHHTRILLISVAIFQCGGYLRVEMSVVYILHTGIYMYSNYHHNKYMYFYGKPLINLITRLVFCFNCEPIAIWLKIYKIKSIVYTAHRPTY